MTEMIETETTTRTTAVEITIETILTTIEAIIITAAMPTTIVITEIIGMTTGESNRQHLRARPLLRVPFTKVRFRYSNRYCCY